MIPTTAEVKQKEYALYLTKEEKAAFLGQYKSPEGADFFPMGNPTEITFITVHLNNGTYMTFRVIVDGEEIKP